MPPPQEPTSRAISGPYRPSDRSMCFGIAARQPRGAFPARLRQPALGLRTRRHRRRKVVNSQRVAAGSCSGEQAMSKRILPVLLVASSLVALIGCGKEDEREKKALYQVPLIRTGEPSHAGRWT